MLDFKKPLIPFPEFPCSGWETLYLKIILKCSLTFNWYQNPHTIFFSECQFLINFLNPDSSFYPGKIITLLKFLQENH